MPLDRAFCKACFAGLELGKALLRDGTVATPFTWECTLFCSPACIAQGEYPFPPEVTKKLIESILADELADDQALIRRLVEDAEDQRQPG